MRRGDGTAPRRFDGGEETEAEAVHDEDEETETKVEDNDDEDTETEVEYEDDEDEVEDNDDDEARGDEVCACRLMDVLSGDGKLGVESCPRTNLSRRAAG